VGDTSICGLVSLEDLEEEGTEGIPDIVGIPSNKALWVTDIGSTDSLPSSSALKLMVSFSSFSPKSKGATTLKVEVILKSFSSKPLERLFPSKRARITVILSSPPRLLAKSINSWQLAAKSSFSLAISFISKSFILLERPSEHINRTSPFNKSTLVTST
jgi:hypothetical protein